MVSSVFVRDAAAGISDHSVCARRAPDIRKTIPIAVSGLRRMFIALLGATVRRGAPTYLRFSWYIFCLTHNLNLYEFFCS